MQKTKRRTGRRSLWRSLALTRVALSGLSRKRAREGAPSTAFAGEHSPVELVREVRSASARRVTENFVRAVVVAAFVLGSVSMALSTVGLTKCDRKEGACVTTTWYPLSVVKRMQVSRDVDGALHGAFTEWFWHGQVAFDGAFVHGAKNGPWREYWPNGNVRFEGTYDLGRREGLEQWGYENGQPEWKGAWKNGRRHGAETWWYETGVVRQAGSFSEGTAEGLFEIFAPDGTRLTTRTVAMNE